MSGLNSVKARRGGSASSRPQRARATGAADGSAVPPDVATDTAVVGGAQTAGGSTPRRTVPFPSDTPRAPPGRHGAPARDPHAAEKALLDDLMGPSVPKASRPPPSSSGAASAAGGADPGLLTAMAARLAKLEAAQRMYRDELVAKDRQLLTIKRELDALRTTAADATAAAKEITGLKVENTDLRQQIHEMETFLNDYGLVWVGSSSSTAADPSLTPAASSDAAPAAAAAPSSAGAGAGAGASGSGGGGRSANAAAAAAAAKILPVNMVQFTEKVRILNSIAGEGKAKVVHENGAHQLRMPEGVSLTMFANGFMLRRGPFRSYADPTNVAFVQDVLDGYFPYEFKTGYPDGIIFNLTDRTAETFDKDDAAFKAFAGQGRAVGSSNKPKTLADMGNPDFALDAKEFLNALPKSVVRNGNVIEVRAGVAERLRGAAAEERPDIVVVDTPMMRTITGSEGRPLTPHDVATIQVKSGSGKQTLIVKLKYNDTIGTLRSFIDDNRTSAEAYELRTAFPAKLYDDPSVTLKDAGLVPNATVMLKVVASS